MDFLFQERHELFDFGLIILSGFILGSLAEKIRLPRIIGYLIAGLALGPQFLGVISQEFLKISGLIITASLSIITFLVGKQLCLKTIKKRKKEIISITLMQALFTFFAVAIGVYGVLFLTTSFSPAAIIVLSLLLGAIGTPTDPSALLSVFEDNKAKGPLVELTYSVTALDDGIGVILFALCASIGVAIISNISIEWLLIVKDIGYKVGPAILLGIAAGFIAHNLRFLIKGQKEVVTLVLGLIFITYSIANYFKFDVILTTMAIGVTLINFQTANTMFFKPIENYLEDIIFTSFFVISAAYLRLDIILEYAWVISAFVILRIAGRLFGSYLGATIANSNVKIKKYLGSLLIPQGGIVIGLALSISQISQFQEIGVALVNITMGVILINEFIGPLIAQKVIARVDKQA